MTTILGIAAATGVVLVVLFFTRRPARRVFMERWFDCPVDGSPVHCRFEAQDDEVKVIRCSHSRDIPNCDRSCALE